MTAPRDPLAADFWQGRCLDCAHPSHEMTCHEMVSNGDPSNGPAYCPCAVNMEWMEQEIVRLRAALAPRPPETADLSCNCKNGDGTSPARYHAKTCPIRTGAPETADAGALDADDVMDTIPEWAITIHGLQGHKALRFAIEAAIRRDATTGLDVACDFSPYYCRSHDSERHSVVDDKCEAALRAAESPTPERNDV